MLAKRKFESVISYGEFTFYGNKKFADHLTAPDEVQLADSSVPQSWIISCSEWINDLTSNIPQSSIISTTGWIKNSITNLENVITDAIDNIYNLLVTKESADNTYAPKENPIFTGTVTFPNEAISQNAINQTTTNGWISTNLQYLNGLKANTSNPTFTGTVTFPDGSAISSTDEDTTIASKSFVYGYFAPKENPVFSGNNVTFPDGSQKTQYAPKASPTFTGTIKLNGM